MLRTLLLTAAALLPALATAQSAKPDGGTIQIASRIVYVDVTVRDSTGNIVRDLTANDFHVFEDGKPQQIDYFTEHTYNPAAPVAKRATGLDFSNSDTTSGYTLGSSKAVTVILLDLLNTSTQEQLAAANRCLSFSPRSHPVALSRSSPSQTNFR